MKHRARLKRIESRLPSKEYRGKIPVILRDRAGNERIQQHPSPDYYDYPESDRPKPLELIVSDATREYNI